MIQMEKVSAAVAYGTSLGSAGFWSLHWLDAATPSQWTAIGVLIGAGLGILTYLTNVAITLFFKIREDRRRARAYKDGKC